MKNPNGKDKCNRDNQERRLGVSQKESGRIGDEQDKVIDFDSKRSNRDEQSSSQRRRKVIGGILSQLMQDNEAQLAYSERQVSYHQKQITDLQKKIQNLNNLKTVLLENSDEILSGSDTEEE